MRMLVVGAGAVGGYFGARLLAAGRHVDFLVRERRARELAETGLVVFSPFGDERHIAPTILERDLGEPYDLILLSCKAYDLTAAIASIVPAVGPDTAILPLNNGVRQIDQLVARFGAPAVLGGVCRISATLEGPGHIRHVSSFHSIRFGELAAPTSERVEAFTEFMTVERMMLDTSPAILDEMWDKFVLFASLAGMTCLMRGNVGQIVAAPSGAVMMRGILAEACAIATAAGHAVPPKSVARIEKMLTDPASTLAASMLLDIERGGRTEADHILGDMLDRADAAGISTPLLQAAYCHLKIYETQQQNKPV